MRFNAPRSPEEAALMNARKKEKKKILLEHRKPTKPSEWQQLGQDWLAWIKKEYSMDIDDYANAHGYPAYSFKKYWPKESEIFKEYLERAYILTKNHHNEYMKKAQKYHLLIMEERPLYNWDLKDYKAEMRKDPKDNDLAPATEISTQPEVTYSIERTEEMQRHKEEKRKQANDTLVK